MSHTLFAYKHIILEFLFSIYCFYLLTTAHLTRSPRFLQKAAVGLGLILVFSFGVAMVYPIWGETVLGRILIYTLLFAATVLQVYVCFAHSFLTILFRCSLAYAAQNICYKLFLILSCYATACCPTLEAALFQYRSLIYYLFFFSAAGLLYLCFIRRIIGMVSSWKVDRWAVLISALILFITVVLCSVEDIYFSKLQTGFSNSFELAEYFVLRQSSNLFSVLCCLVVLMLICRTIEQRDLKQHIEHLEYVVRQSEKQYNISKETMELIHIKFHDIHYKLNALAADMDTPARQIVDDLRQSIALYDSQIETGNKFLDVLLTEKNLYCQQHNIRLTCMVDGQLLSFMDGADAYCLFGNILDNALTAVNQLENLSQRVISLNVQQRGPWICVQAENYYQGSITFKNELPVTTKPDKNYHGFGMQSIRMIAHKYEGTLSVKAENQLFELTLLFLR